MAWTPLKENYTDAIWAGLKKYNLIENSDDTISLQDVTVYSNKENSFFGAKDANAMNAAINIIMAMLENGTDLYTNFQNYFATQQTLFEETADEKQAGLTAYVANLEAQGDALIQQIETDYSAEIQNFEDVQEQIFNVWFASVRGQLDGDVAGQIINRLNAIDEREFNRYYGMCTKTTSIATVNGNKVITENDTGELVQAVTTISTVATGKQIVTVVTPTSGSYNYRKTVLIEKSNGTTTITESYVKEAK
jgi:hypothetical protein